MSRVEHPRQRHSADGLRPIVLFAAVNCASPVGEPTPLRQSLACIGILETGSDALGLAGFAAPSADGPRVGKPAEPCDLAHANDRSVPLVLLGWRLPSCIVDIHVNGDSNNILKFSRDQTRGLQFLLLRRPGLPHRVEEAGRGTVSW